MSNTLFYSQVNKALQTELKARAAAGATDRSTKALNFMLEKVANVEITPYDDDKLDKPVKGGILGGSTMREGAFVPTGLGAFLPPGSGILKEIEEQATAFVSDKSGDVISAITGEDTTAGLPLNSKRPVYRTTPYISTVSTQIYDQSRGYLNKATFDIMIPDPTSDMDIMESIYCIPGRNVKIEIQHPDSAIISDEFGGGQLSPEELVDYTALKATYPNITEEEIRLLNRVTFNGKISTFSYNYENDGSAKITVECLGTTGTYITVSSYITENLDDKDNVDSNNPSQKSTNTVSSFYKAVLKEMDTKMFGDNPEPSSILNKEIKIDDKDYQSILYGTYYSQGENAASESQYKFLSLGLLVKYVNDFLLKKLDNDNEGTGTNQPAQIICTDEFCKSNRYDDIVSADPTRILLWPGLSKTNTNVYGEETNVVTLISPLSNTPQEFEFPPLTAFESVQPVTPGFLTGTIPGATSGAPGLVNFLSQEAYPARIYINIEIIKELVEKFETNKKDITIKDIFIGISDEISRQTGDAFRLKLIQHPVLEKALLFYDTEYNDSTTSLPANQQESEASDAIEQIGFGEFTMPAFAGDGGATAVKELSITSKVPDSVKSMIYGISAGSKTFNRNAVYSPYVYATKEKRDVIAKEYQENHEQSLKELKEKKADKALNPQSEQATLELQKALAKYNMFPYPDIKQSIKIQNPAFPLEISLTLDGINGFKWGDILNVAGLPKKYQRTFVFMVIGIVHNVDTTGEWNTQLQLKARVRILD